MSLSELGDKCISEHRARLGRPSLDGFAANAPSWRSLFSDETAYGTDYKGNKHVKQVAQKHIYSLRQPHGVKK